MLEKEGKIRAIDAVHLRAALDRENP